MTPRPLLLPLGAALALAAPAPALAAWTAPVTVDPSGEANQLSQRAFGGSVLTGWLDPVVWLSKRDGDGYTKPQPITVADSYERAWAAGLDDQAPAIVLTLRRPLPVQRVRATFVTADGRRSGPVTISDHAHSASQPHLDVAPDGTAVAAWQWHDSAGWRAKAAIRRPGEARFGTPQNVSPPAPASGRAQSRPW